MLDQHWDRLALRRTLEELLEDQRLIAEAVTRARPPAVAADIDKVLEAWLSAHAGRAQMVKDTMADLEATGAWTFAKSILAAAEVRALAAASQ
jgi:glutamate dehydrogenase